MSEIEHPEIRWVVYPTHLDGSLIGTQPRMRHLEQCGHFEWGDRETLGTPVLATDEQMRILPPCKDCLAREFGDSEGGHPQLGRVGQPCPICHMALPLTGVCDNCG